jgi:hypothetical protein
VIVLEILGSVLLTWALLCFLFGLQLEATRPKGGSPENKQWLVVLIVFLSPFLWLRDLYGQQDVD